MSQQGAAIFNELDQVQVVRLHHVMREVDGTERVRRQPKVGDLGTVVALVRRGSDAPGYYVECVDEEGLTVWLTEFDRDELAAAPHAHELPIRALLGNVLKGLSLGLFVATGLSAWVLLLRTQAGTAPFDRLHTTLTATILGYYRGGATGGLLVGFAWPLRRWLLGYALLGILGAFPFYLFASGGPENAPLLTTENLATALLGAFFVGAAVGVWAWSDDHPHGPGWFDALRFPTVRTTGAVWAGALFIAILAMVLVPKWSFYWPFQVIVFAAGILFIVPLLTAVLVTLRFYRRQQER